ncbi:MAG: ABC transporter permease subunit/CPBP intramembrane protease [Candidatus Xenobiia bacterium LiM19]
MNLARIKYLYLKEMTEIMRNWGLIILLVFFPLIVYPTSLLFLSELSASQKAKLESQKSHIVVKGAAHCSELVQMLKDDSDLDVALSDMAPQDSVPSVNKVMINVPEEIRDIANNGKSVSIQIFYDFTDEESALAKLRVQEVLQDYKKELTYRRLDSQKLSPEFLEPVALNFKNVASEKKMIGQRLGETLPLMLIMFIMLGTIQVAIDLTAGEKDRKTIQTLLLSPLSRLEILSSKLLVVLTTTIFTTTTNFISIGLTFFMVASAQGKTGPVMLSIGSIILSLILSIPLVVLISALFLLMGIIAKNQLEANIYVLPVLLAGMLPAALPSLPAVKYDIWMNLVPVANTALMVKTIFNGTFTMTNYVITFLANSVYAVLMMLFVSKVFRQEDIAFGGLSDVIFVKKDQKVPSPGEAVVYFCTVLALFYFVGVPLQMKHQQLGLVASLIICLMLPAFFLIRRFKYDIRKVFKLENPGPLPLILAPLIAWACIIISQIYAGYQEQIFRTPDEVKKFMETIVVASNARELIIALLVVAATPAIFEELAYRGFVLSGLESSLKRPVLCLVVGFLFGINHVNLYTLIPITFLGAVMAYVVVKTGSIYPAMLIHFIVNGTQVVLANYLTKEITIPPYAALIALVVLAICLRVIPDRQKSLSSKGTTPQQPRYSTQS